MIVGSAFRMIFAGLFALLLSCGSALGQEVSDQMADDEQAQCVTSVDPVTNAVTALCPQFGPPALVAQMEDVLTKQLAERTAKIVEKSGGVLTPSDREKLSKGVQSSARRWSSNYKSLISIISSGHGAEEASAHDAVTAGDFAGVTPLLVGLVNRADIDSQRRAWASHGLGALELLRDHPEKALPHFEQAARLAPEVLDHRAAIAQMAGWLNRNYYAEATWNDFIALGRQKIATDPAGGRATVGRGLEWLGDFYYQNGRLPEAIKAYEEALSLFRDANMMNSNAYNQDMVEVLDALAQVQAAMGDGKRAGQTVMESLAIYRKLAETDPVFRSKLAFKLNSIGSIHIENRYLKSAEEYYQESLKIYQSLDLEHPEKYRLHIMHVKRSIALIYSRTQRTLEAYDIYEDALAFYRSMDGSAPGRYQGEIARTLLNMGGVKYGWNQLSEARDLFEAALAIGRERAKTNRDDAIPSMATALTNLGDIYCDKGRGDDSKAAFYEAFDIYTELNQKYQNAYAQPLERVKAKILKRKTCFP